MKTQRRTDTISAHLAYLPSDIYSMALGQVLYTQYQQQSGKNRRSGFLTGLKKYQTDPVATVRGDGSWRIINTDWKRGGLPNQIVEATFQIVRSLGDEHPSREKLTSVISQSVLKVGENEHTVSKGHSQMKAKKKDGMSRRERRNATKKL